MKDYYEILEVNKNASKEIIDKAFKTLAKKYHPDANSTEDKEWAEEKFKEINEAYEILSDEEKRKKYNTDIGKENALKDEQLEKLKLKYSEMLKENEMLKVQIRRLNGTLNIDRNAYESQMKKQITNVINNSVNKAYHDAYVQRMKDHGYKIKYKKSFKERVKNFLNIIIAGGITILIMFILWQIPPIREYIKSIFFWM